MNQEDLKTIKENGYTYIQLYIRCPVCIDRNINTSATLWIHHNCGGDIYVGDNAFYKCLKCGVSAHVMKWAYNCPGHSNSPDEFVGASCQALASAISTAGQLTTILGITWLQVFLDKLKEYEDNRNNIRNK